MYRIIGADGNEYGPVSAEVLRQWVTEGRANGQTRVQVEGSTDWKPLGEIHELIQTVQSPPTTMVAPATITPPTPARRTNPLAVAGTILGIASLTFCLCCYGLPFNLAGLACSLVSLRQIQNNPQEQGKGLAITGLVLSIISLLLGVVILVSLRSYGSGELLRRIQRL